MPSPRSPSSMATKFHESGALNALSESDIKAKFTQLRDAIPALDQYEHSPILPVLLDEAECRNLILPVMTRGITDVWLPLSPDNISDYLDPGAHFRFMRKQNCFLANSFTIPQGASLGRHFNPGDDHLCHDPANTTKLPRGLKLMRPLGDGGFGLLTRSKRFI